MKKKRLYVVLATVTSIIIFTTAAICNMCAPATEAEVSESDTGNTNGYSAEEAEGTSAQQTSQTQEPQAQQEPSLPTIELKISEGPVYESANTICYYRIEAVATGYPTPDITWSRDDSGATLGENISRINLYDSSETYTLTATCANSEGTASESIKIIRGCKEHAGKGGGGDEDEEGLDFELPEMPER